MTFVPDLEKFGMTHLDDDILALLYKRVIDMVNIVGGKVKIYLNDEPIKIKKYPV